jgi:arginine-tRNA-protein transferase
MAQASQMTAVSTSLEDLKLLLTMPHPCGYFPDREAKTLVVDPKEPMSPDLYSQLSALGFRRSGDMVYRPHCSSCAACIPCRVDVERFQASHRQQRIWKRNMDLQVTVNPSPDLDEHLLLFKRYLLHRHPGGGMDSPDSSDPLDFITSDWCNSSFYEFRQHQTLLAAAVVDHLDTGLSAVYTYFETEEKQRSLGVFAILWEINQARHMKLPWLYLGYWIQDCAKMSYKDQYQPQEIYLHNQWVKHPQVR